MSRDFIKSYLSDSDFEIISSKISEAEKDTRGEIRLSIRHKRHWNERRLTLQQIALKEFHRLGMQKTKERTGVLILFLFNERSFHILADEGIHSKVEGDPWMPIAELLSSHFKKGNYRQGVCEAIGAIGTILKKHVPQKSGDVNELPDDVIVR